MKLSIKHATWALLLGASAAHPGLSEDELAAPCPFQEQQNMERRRRLGQGWYQPLMRALGQEGDGGVPEGGFKAVIKDLKDLMTDSKEYWPADGGHYGGLFVRLAWHCAGSYRRSDGRGGCDGGRIRYDPELNWPDNANLDKALELLKPIKAKYGSQLSWGDLIILSGTAAIESMGGPVLGFCGGRIDDKDGSDSLKLGPSEEQQQIGPCDDDLQGNCLNYEGTALGTGTVGLIYVNPGGPVDFPGDPVASGHDIRNVFSNGMSFDDRETVAIVGGGHAFGKAHGACKEPPCGDGKGANTFTSGFEGAWTTNPAKWDNEFFTNLFDFEWELVEGPGPGDQWVPKGDDTPDVIMLTSDIALSVDEKYRVISMGYANDLHKLEDDFAKAWFKLVTADMGPSTRCIGDLVPPAQPFQNDLPAPPKRLPNYVPTRRKIEKLLTKRPEHKDALINLAYRCASTFRKSDYNGGCNGARIRFPPESEWSENKGTSEALSTLEEVKTNKISWSDLIVLAGLTALESKHQDLDLPFCGGRVDADGAAFSKDLSPRDYKDPLITILDDYLVKGLAKEEGVALACRHNVGSGYYQKLLGHPEDFDDYERAMLHDNELKTIVQDYADNEEMIQKAFTKAWTKLMTADRYLDNRLNACEGVYTQTKKKSKKDSDSSSSD